MRYTYLGLLLGGLFPSGVSPQRPGLWRETCRAADEMVVIVLTSTIEPTG
jgi:hypothetical protein